MYGICSTIFLVMNIEVAQVVWDDINKEHIWSKHKLSQDEVEQAVWNKSRLATQLANGRILLLGITEKRKLISVIISPKDIARTIWYPVTARRASRKEHYLFNQSKGGEYK
mgnify:CR=1 FL=1